MLQIRGEIAVNTQVIGPKMKRWAGIFVMLLSMMVFLAPITQAADKVAYRVVYHTLKVDSKEVGDVPGHVQGSGQQAGLAFFTKGPGKGEIATRTSSFTFDYVKGKGTFTNDIVYTFRDGSTMTIKAIGTSTPVDGGKRPTFKGTYEVAGGTGKFAGMKGKGTFKGERLGPRETGGDSYADVTGTSWK